MRIDALTITSPDLEFGTPLRDEFSALGGNIPPRLVIDGVPDGTTELAVICHDADAPLPYGFTHWLVFGIQAAGPGPVPVAPSEARQAPNDRGKRGYHGPQPPRGHGTHHYYFWAYALDRAVEGEPTREEFLARYGPHIIEQNRLMGTFARESISGRK